MPRKQRSAQPLPEVIQSPPSDEPPRRSLETYDDYVKLIGDTINDVLDKRVDTKTAQCVGLLTGYGIQCLKEARGGKLRMSVFLNDMRKVRVEMLSPEEMDRFLQGSEEIQMEVLKSLEGRGGIIQAAEVQMQPKRDPKQRLDTKLISKMTGIRADKVADALNGEAVEAQAISVHAWETSFGGKTRFCLNCGKEASQAESDEVSAACSEVWGLW